MGLLDLLTGARTVEEGLHDFLGVVEIDQVGRLGILVLPEHVAALVRVSGTDYASGSTELKEDIVDAWATVLNNAGVSVQLFVHRAPIVWDLPGGFLDLMREQVEADLHSDWQVTRYERMEAALLAGELDNWPVMEQRTYAVLRHFIGASEMKTTGRSGSPMYVPPRRSIRFWETPQSTFGDGDRGYAAWQEKRDAAAEALAQITDRFLRDLSLIPSMTADAAGRLEIAQLLHVLWRSDRSAQEWLASDADIERILGGESLMGAIDPPPSSHEDITLPHPRRRARNGRLVG